MGIFTNPTTEYRNNKFLWWVALPLKMSATCSLLYRKKKIISLHLTSGLYIEF